MPFEETTVTIFGGTGFIGSQVVRELADLGMRIKVACRIPERAYDLRPCGVVGQVVPVAVDYNDGKSVGTAIKGSDYVVNCIGILFEKKKNDFQRIHVQLPNMIARECKQHGVKRFVQISALGVEDSQSKYGQSKLDGEKAILKSFPKATILRPSIVFGAEDQFFNMFAQMSMILPVLPLIGGGKTKFQPVFVGDVADAVVKTLTAKNDKHCGQTYELGGPEVVSFREIYERLFEQTGRKRALISLPWGIAKLQAMFMGLLPKPPLTVDQVISLKTDNVVGDDAITLADLDIDPTAMDSILPSYLNLYKPGGKFADEVA